MGRGTHCDLPVDHHAATEAHLRSGALRLVLRLPGEQRHGADVAEQHLQKHERDGGIRACLSHSDGGLSLAGRAGHYATSGDALIESRQKSCPAVVERLVIKRVLSLFG